MTLLYYLVQHIDVSLRRGVVVQEPPLDMVHGYMGYRGVRVHGTWDMGHGTMPSEQITYIYIHIYTLLTILTLMFLFSYVMPSEQMTGSSITYVCMYVCMYVRTYVLNPLYTHI
jgi:hypothetical protein